MSILKRALGASKCYFDQKDESFYTVSWACNVDGAPLLVAGGINGIMRVLDAGNEKIYKVFSPLLASQPA